MPFEANPCETRTSKQGRRHRPRTAPVTGSHRTAGSCPSSTPCHSTPQDSPPPMAIRPARQLRRQASFAHPPAPDATRYLRPGVAECRTHGKILLPCCRARPVARAPRPLDRQATRASPRLDQLVQSSTIVKFLYEFRHWACFSLCCGCDRIPLIFRPASPNRERQPWQPAMLALVTRSMGT